MIDMTIGFHSNILESRGTANMLKQAQERNIPTRLITGR